MKTALRPGLALSAPEPLLPEIIEQKKAPTCEGAFSVLTSSGHGGRRYLSIAFTESRVSRCFQPSSAVTRRLKSVSKSSTPSSKCGVSSRTTRKYLPDWIRLNNVSSLWIWKRITNNTPPVVIESFKEAHDRFLIIDEAEIYHIGASL